jgi:hypothetical protein
VLKNIGFLTKNLFPFYILPLLFAMLTISGKCQRTLSNQAVTAINLFENQKYSEAVSQFQKLMARFPEDLLYQYYYAACMIELNTNTDQAISLLISCLKREENADAYFYLGMAYYRQFKWEEAQQAFYKAWKLIDSKTINSKKILKYAGDFEDKLMLIKQSTEIYKGAKIQTLKIDSIKDFLINQSSIKSRRISFQGKEFITFIIKSNTQADDSSIVFFAYRKNPKDNFDIYCRYSKNGSSKIELLKKPINSGDDEIFPIYDPSLKLLYFASDRGTSLGGFDIYCCKFDIAQQNILEIRQLAFPVNSQWDEFAWFPGNKNYYILLSMRETDNSETSIYCLQKQSAQLSLSSSLYDRCFFQHDYQLSLSKNEFNSILSKNKQNSLANKKYIAINERSEKIQKALMLQRIVDSLQLENREKYRKISNMENNVERKKLYAAYKNKEGEIQSLQAKANEYYEEILPSSEVERSYDIDTTNTTVPIEFSIEKKPVYNLENPIPEQLNLPPGVVYTIQLGAFSKKVNPQFFGGIQPIMAEFLSDKNLIKYYAGIFKSYVSADSSLQKIRSAGFKEAFIVAYFDNKKIPLSRAKELEINLSGTKLK